jgi:hypothetical protein
MPKQGPKSRPLSAGRSNPYQHRLPKPINQLMSGVAAGFLRTARGEDINDNSYDDSDISGDKETRCRS